MISRTSCAQRHPAANLAAQTSASSREATSMIENPPMTAFVSGTGPAVTVPSVATMVDCWRWTPPPKIQTPAAFASRTTLCDAAPTDGQSSSGIWSIEPSSNEIKYRKIGDRPRFQSFSCQPSPVSRICPEPPASGACGRSPLETVPVRARSFRSWHSVYWPPDPDRDAH
jgi:uncharacterized cupin superfamily protein